MSRMSPGEGTRSRSCRLGRAEGLGRDGQGQHPGTGRVCMCVSVMIWAGVGCLGASVCCLGASVCCCLGLVAVGGGATTLG